MKFLDAPDNKCNLLIPLSDIARAKDMVHVVGYQHVHPNENYPKDGFPDVCLFKDRGGRCLNSYQLIYIASGKGFFRDRGLSYDVSAGDIILIQPWLWHFYEPDPQTGWEEYYIGFNGKDFSRLIHELFSLTNVNLIRVNAPDKIFPIFSTALIASEWEAVETQMVSNALLTYLIQQLKTHIKVENSPDLSLATKARKFMEDNISKKINLDDIAAHLCVSSSRFRADFKHQTGISPGIFLQRIRLQRAKYLLLTSTLSVKQIAAACGFNTTEYFCIFFKSQTGQTPSEFRELAKTEQ